MTDEKNPHSPFVKPPSYDEINAREATILGEPPRIPPVAIKAVSQELLALIQRMVIVNEAINSREQRILKPQSLALLDDATTPETIAFLAKIPEIIGTMLHHPRLFDRQLDIGVQLLPEGALASRDRELVILRTGWLSQAPYEWGEHVVVAKTLGITGEEIERIIIGSSAEGWSELEKALLCSVEELLADAMITDTTWAILERYLSTAQLIELPILIGQYQTIAYYQNSLRLKLHSGNEGLKAR